MARNITFLCFVLTLATTTTHIISFASNHWYKSTVSSGFQNLGLWSVCFKQYLPPPWGQVTKKYEGCYWALDKELDDLRHYLYPAWFRATQGLVSFSLVLLLLTVITLVINVINCFPYSPKKYAIRSWLSCAAACMLLLTGLFMTIAVIMFGVSADTSSQWLEFPDKHFLSWSFGLAIVTAFLAVFAGMAQMMEFLKLRNDDLGMEEASPRVLLANTRPPPNNYIYSARSVDEVDTQRDAGDPNYVRKYARSEQESLSSSVAAVDEPFKISGHMNRLADRDERDYYERKHGRGRNGYPSHRDQSDRDFNRRDTVVEEEEEDDSQMEHTEEDDYDGSKGSNHPVLPEYVPKQKVNKKVKDTIDEKDDSSYDSENVKRKSSKSKDKRRSSKNRSESGGKKKRGDDSSDDERRVSRGKRHSRSGSRRHHSRSRSRDLNNSYTDDSDARSTSSRSRSKNRHREEKSSRKHSRSRRSSRERSRSRDRNTDSRKKKQSGTISDDGSKHGRGSRSKSDRKQSHGRSRDYSDSESTRSRRVDKPKGTYSSYYES